MSEARPPFLTPMRALAAAVGLATVAALVASPTFASRTAAAAEQTTGPRVAPLSAEASAARRVATPSTADCGGVRLKKANGTPWTCYFGDEFDGSGLDRTKWQVQQTANSGFRNGPECYRDSRKNIAVTKGALFLTARENKKTKTCTDPVGGDFSSRYSGAMVTTWDRFSQAYGKFQVRAKFPAAKTSGLHSAIWLWPQNQQVEKYGQWPASGEIDVAEFYTQYPDRAVPYLHYAQRSSASKVTNNYCYVKNPEQYHVYELTWTKKKITIRFDGKTCLSTAWDPKDPQDNPAPFDRPYVLNLTQALGLNGSTNQYRSGSTPLPATTKVDWVRVWK